MAGFQPTKGSFVEVSSDEPGFQGAWYVATLVDVIKDSPTTKKKKSSTSNKNRNKKKKKMNMKMGYLVRYETLFEEDNMDERLTEVVDPSFVRPLPPRNEEGVEDNIKQFDVVDAFRRDGWWMGVVNKVFTDGDEEITKYIVSFENPDEEVEFQRSQLRLHVDWVDSRWQLPPKITMETSEAENGKSNNKRKRGRPPKLQVKRPNGSLVGTELNDGRNLNSSASREIPSDLDEQPLSVWYQGLLPLSVLKRSSCCCPCNESSGALNQKIIANKGGTTTITTTATDYQQRWPFIKQSPIWATIDSVGVHQTFTQKPHFSPLEKIKEDFREGLAIAHMVTYENLVHKISKFQSTDSVDIINNSLQTLVELENHGFDGVCIRARLNKLVSLKSQLREHLDKKEKAAKELEKLELNKSVVEDKIIQVKLKLQELKEKKAQTVEEIMRSRSILDVVSSKILDCDLAFEKVAATPL